MAEIDNLSRLQVILPSPPSRTWWVRTVQILVFDNTNQQDEHSLMRYYMLHIRQREVSPKLNIIMIILDGWVCRWLHFTAHLSTYVLASRSGTDKDVYHRLSTARG